MIYRRQREKAKIKERGRCWAWLAARRVAAWELLQRCGRRVLWNHTGIWNTRWGWVQLLLACCAPMRSFIFWMFLVGSCSVECSFLCSPLVSHRLNHIQAGKISIMLKLFPDISIVWKMLVFKTSVIEKLIGFIIKKKKGS